MFEFVGEFLDLVVLVAVVLFGVFWLLVGVWLVWMSLWRSGRGR